MKERNIKRILEIIPGVLSWSIIFSLLIIFLFAPLTASVIIIIYLLYWVCRLLYSSILLMMAHHRIQSKKKSDWLALSKQAAGSMHFNDVIHVVLYTTYKEPVEVLHDSLTALTQINYPKDKVIVVLAGEAREEGALRKLEGLKQEYASGFREVLITIHPADVEGEIRSKGANATYAARRTREYLESQGIDLKTVVISCFDADTCCDKDYFACLTYNFLTAPKRYQVSFQPLPIYSNNIYRAPAFARVVETGSTFWQLIEGMRYEKFITFSSHSMSFKTLVDVNYWPVDLISDDSLIFWKCFLKFNGDYRTHPLEVPVYMDIAVGKNLINTVMVQYKQKRRWAWGVENFIFLGARLYKNKKIPLLVKIRKLYQILDGHVNWATWAIVVSFITPLVLLWGKISLKNSLVLFNLSYINSVVFDSLTFILALCIFISWEFLPPRPKGVSRFIFITFLFQWILTPFISATLGSFPALDAQTRLMLGKYLVFNTTPKKRHTP